jgi:hypothetical protein
MREHRVPMLGTALRRRVDPQRSRDPRVRELVAALATLDVAPPPRAQFRDELRAQLVAVAPRLVEEGEPQSAASPHGQAKAVAEPAPRKSGFRIAKPLIAAACVLTAFVVLLGGAVLLSRNALPGDALYSVKRASEDTQYGLTGGTVAKGKLKLEFAGRRIGEVAALLPKAGALAPGAGNMADSGQLSADTSKLVRQTLGAANGDVQTAAQMLGAAAVHGRSASPLRTITSWTPGQIAAMNAIVARIPAGSLHQSALGTRNLLVAAQARATALSTELGCSCLESARTDKLGPIPCATGCSPTTPGTPTPGSSTGPGGSSTTTRPPANTPGGATTTAPGAGSSTAPPATPGSTRSGGSSTGTSPGGGSKPPKSKTTTPTLPGIPTLPGHPRTSLPKLPKPPHSSSTKLPISVSSSCVVLLGVSVCV